MDQHRGRTDPTITVAIPTRNRAPEAVQCLESVSRVTYPQWDVLVIDQSDGDDTELAIASVCDRLPRLQYTRMNVTGLTRARNLALRSASGEILAFIDDDCTVDPNWLHAIAVAVERHPEVSLIFGQVHPAPHDPRQCFIPGHELSRERVLDGRLAFLQAGSIMGASMYLRREVCRSVGPFDVYAGPGAQFYIEDRDYAYRVLGANHRVLVTPHIHVVHHGKRYYRHKETRALVRSYPYGYGAQDAKFLRCGDRLALLVIVGHVIKMLRFILWRRLMFGGVRGSHGTWILMYLAGLYAGCRVPVMREYGLWGTPEDYAAEDLSVCRLNARGR